MTTYREARRAGRLPLGAHVAGTEAARVIAALLDEGYHKGEIATWLGYQCAVLRVLGGAGVTLRTTVKLKKLQRRLIS
jgi:hypothetical protein